MRSERMSTRDHFPPANQPVVVGEDFDAARALVDQAEDAELFLYPGEPHLFADSSLPSYERDAAARRGRISFGDDLGQRSRSRRGADL
jgi:hypothetical protein